MSDTTGIPASASVWEAQLLEYLGAHVQRERHLLEGYVQAAEASGSQAFRYVVELLAEDERRHHRLFSQLAESLRADAELSSEAPAIPRLDFQRADGDAVLDLTRTLIANEETDAAELKRLQRELKDLKDTTLWSLVVETMQLDTQKHIAILRFVERHAKPQRRH